MLNFRSNYFIKFGLSEKHTKFAKIFLMVLSNRLIYLVNVKTMRKIEQIFVAFSEKLDFNGVVKKILLR